MFADSWIGVTKGFFWVGQLGKMVLRSLVLGWDNGYGGYVRGCVMCWRLDVVNCEGVCFIWT